MLIGAIWLNFLLILKYCKLNEAQIFNLVSHYSGFEIMKYFIVISEARQCNTKYCNIKINTMAQWEQQLSSEVDTKFPL